MLIESHTVESFNMSVKSFDCGDKLGYMKAFVEYCLRYPKLGGDFKKELAGLLEEYR
jgi:UTP--glucose-1-phosphate uridylyltransferase